MNGSGMAIMKWTTVVVAAALMGGCGPGTPSNPGGTETTGNAVGTGANTAPTGITYEQTYALYGTGTAIADNIATTTGGTASSYGISPALPAGLTLDSANGRIGGTPNATSPTTTYAVVAGNALGSTQTKITITVVNPGTWTTVAAPASPHFGGTATLLDDGTVLVAGGLTSANSNTAPVAIAETYNPKTNTWTTVGAMNSPRLAHTATLLTDGTVLVIGGYATPSSNTTALGSAEIYNPSTRQWHVIATLNQARAFHTATRLPDGSVLAAGGTSGAPIFGMTSTERYVPSSGTWTTAGSMLAAELGHTATLLSNGQVLVAGLMGERYTPATDSWTSTGAMNVPRSLHKAALQQNGNVLIAGGLDVNGNNISSTEIYDVTSDTWTATGALSATRIYHGMATLLDGSVLVAGGEVGSTSTASTSAERYTPGTGTWANTGSLALSQENAEMLRLPSGQVLSIGSDAEVYVP